MDLMELLKVYTQTETHTSTQVHKYRTCSSEDIRDGVHKQKNTTAGQQHTPQPPLLAVYPHTSILPTLPNGGGENRFPPLNTNSHARVGPSPSTHTRTNPRRPRAALQRLAARLPTPSTTTATPTPSLACGDNAEHTADKSQHAAARPSHLHTHAGKFRPSQAMAAAKQVPPCWQRASQQHNICLLCAFPDGWVQGIPTTLLHLATRGRCQRLGCCARSAGIAETHHTATGVSKAEPPPSARQGAAETQ